MTEWKVITDGDETTLTIPEGETPERDKDFTVPERDGYTPDVVIDPETKTVTITYKQNTTDWVIDTDGDESTITLPEGKLPIEDEDFVVPARDGHTPTVVIDEDAHKVKITYEKNAEPEPVIPPVEPVDPVDPEPTTPTEPDDGNKDKGDENDNKNLVETGKPSPAPAPAPEEDITPNDTPQAGIGEPDIESDEVEEIVEPMLIPDSLIVAPDSPSDAATGDNSDTDGDKGNTDDRKADSASNIEDNKTPLSEFDAPEPAPFPWMNILLGIMSGFLVIFLLLLLLLKRGKWTLMSEGLSDNDAWVAKIKCRKDEGAIEKKLEDFEVPTVDGYVVSQRVIDEDDKKVVYFYTAQ